MKRRSFIGAALALLLPTNLISTENQTGTGTARISALVEDEYAPYVVSGTIRNAKMEIVKTFQETVLRGAFDKLLTFPTRVPLTIDISVTAARSGSLNGYVQVNETSAKIQGDQRVTTSNIRLVA